VFPCEVWPTGIGTTALTDTAANAKTSDASGEGIMSVCTANGITKVDLEGGVVERSGTYLAPRLSLKLEVVAL
jgi:hypothetical protein